MKHVCVLVISVLVTLVISNKSFSQNTLSVNKDPYLGQKPPGKVAEPIAPDIFPPKGWELGKIHDKDMEEFYFTPSIETPFEPTVIVFRKENNAWKKHNFHAAVSGNDNILYDEAKYIERTKTGWSKIKSLGPMFDREDWGIMRLSVSAKGTYVFDDAKNNDVIRISRIKDGKRQKPKLLGKQINTGKWTAHPFIAPDESYLIWDSERDEGFGGADIYISFRQQDESWGAAINLGDKINSPLWENGAMVTPDGKYLLFGRSEKKVSKDGSTYWVSQQQWVDAQIIENLRPKR